MRKFLIALTLGAAMLLPALAFAATVPKGCEGVNYSTPGCPGFNVGGSVSDCPEGVLGAPCEAWKATNAALTGAASLIDGIGNLFSMATVYYVMWGLALALYKFAQICFALAAWYMDGAIFYLVLYMGYFINSADANGIREAWAAFRDIGNLMIIAGFIAVGISTILQVAQYASDKFLARLIIAALLINFSYFFAGAIIDASNYFAAAVWQSKFVNAECTTRAHLENTTSGGIGGLLQTGINQIRGTDTSDMCSFGRSMAKTVQLSTFNTIEYIACVNSGLANCSKDTSILGTGGSLKNVEDTGKRAEVYWQLFILTALAGIFTLIFAAVIAMAAFLLIVRFAALILLLITSPLGIGGMNIPYLESVAGRWWEALTSQAIFAPIFFILLAISLKVTNALVSFVDAGGRSFGAALNSANQGPAQGIIGGNLAMFIVYFVSVTLMVMSFVIARQIASSTHELKGLYDMAAQRGWGIATSPAQLLGLGTRLGLAGGRIAAERTAAGYSTDTWFGWGLRRIGSTLRTGERLVSGAKEGEKSSAELSDEAILKYKKDRYNRKEKAPVTGTFWQQPINSLNPFRGFSKQVTGEIYNKEPLVDADGKLTEKGERIKKALKGASLEDLLDRYGEEKLNELVAAGAVEVTDKMHEDFMESDTASEAAKKSLSEAVLSPFMKAFSGGNFANAAHLLQNMSDYQRKLLLTEKKELMEDKNFHAMMKHDQYEKFIQENYKTKDAADAAREMRKSGHAEIIENGSAGSVKSALGNMSEKEKMTLDIKYFSSAKVMEHLSIDDLKKRYNNNPNERDAIVKAAAQHQKNYKGLSEEQIHAELSDKSAPGDKLRTDGDKK